MDIRTWLIFSTTRDEKIRLEESLSSKQLGLFKMSEKNFFPKMGRGCNLMATSIELYVVELRIMTLR